MLAFSQAGYCVHFASAATPTEHQIDLSQLGITCHSIKLNDSSFDEFCQALSPQLVIFDRYITEEQFGWRVAGACPDAMRILDTEDLHCLRAARERALKRALKQDTNAGPVSLSSGELVSCILEDDMVLREVAAILRSDVSLMISDVEIQLLTDYFCVPESALLHMPFMVEPDSSAPAGFNERQHFVSIGNFRHAPNWDAVLWLKQNLWPAIRRRVKGAELHIYGAYPPKKATALSNTKEGFIVKGWAEDALSVIGQARVLLAPLRFGAGIKGKLIDAMLCATPSVATEIAAEAMYGDLPWPGAIVKNAEEFAQAAAELYSNSDYWQQASDLAVQLLQQRYCHTKLSAELTEKIEARREQLAMTRRDNFLSRMFQYHSARSTEFMSRWIEAKSRTHHD